MGDEVLVVLQQILGTLQGLVERLDKVLTRLEAGATPSSAASAELVEVKAASLDGGEWGVRLPEGVEGAPGQRCRKVLKNGDAFTVVLDQRVSTGRYGETWRTTGNGGSTKAKPAAAAPPPDELAEDDIPF